MQLIFSAGLILAVVLWGLLAPASLGAFFDQALAAITRHFGWLYLWIVLGLVLMALLLAFSRYGSLKLGGEDDEPEFSLGTWFAMLFAAGMGIGLVFWGVAEPISHFITPPPGIAARTPEAANAAMRYSFFHWGLHPWAVYSIIALAIAFFQFRRGGAALVSVTIEALPWRWARHVSVLANVLAVIATAFGVAASLGMGALQINSGLHAVFGMPVGASWQVGIIVVTTALHQEIWQSVPIDAAVTADMSTALFAMFEALPLSTLMSGVATVLVVVFFVTSADSATLVLGMMSTGGRLDPPARVKVMWGLLVSGVALSLLLAGGLKAVQTATIVFALPFTVVLVLMAVSLWRAIRADWLEEQRQERLLRQRMRELLAAQSEPKR